jgi:calcineurin-like phosphoesterase family protein
MSEDMTPEEKAASIAAMNAKIIANYNAVVQPNDEVWCLGDFAFRYRREQLETIFDQLHGHKHLIKGNHDDKYVFRLPWQSQADYADIKIDGRHVVLCHYAIIQWNRSRYGAVHLHGHHHGTLPPITNRIDVGVDCFNLSPVAWDQLKASISPHELPRDDHQR